MIPEYLKNKLIGEYGKELFADITNSYRSIRKTTLRVNTLKSSIDEIKEILDSNNISFREVEWSNFSLILDNACEEDIRRLDIYKEGKIYLQSLSSQLPPLFVNPQAGELILDMTAAPGGKTTEMAALADNEVLITAIEKNKKRYERLKYNIEHLGAKKISVLNVDARNLDEYFMFDKILLDAPCSGSGTLNIKTINDFSEELVNRLVIVQKDLINEALKHLKVNGDLIYSTCSILKEENEQIIKEILSMHKDIELIPLDISMFSNIPILPVEIDSALCVKPTDIYEGFFVVKIRKIK
ncbi:MAG TPA: Fmu (Sun) domain-containing protein [Firmicutes bacterium]|nr:Fmu (Sun) domain-containing protein [Bacillota bacterium]